MKTAEQGIGRGGNNRTASSPSPLPNFHDLVDFPCRCLVTVLMNALRCSTSSSLQVPRMRKHTVQDPLP